MKNGNISQAQFGVKNLSINSIFVFSLLNCKMPMFKVYNQEYKWYNLF